MMPNMGICEFSAGNLKTDFVAPKSDYASKEDFVEACKAEFDWYEEEHEEIWEKISVGNVTESFCRWYPVPPEGCDWDSACYSFSKEGKGAFPVWRIELA